MTETTQPDVAEMEWVLVPRVPTEAMLDAGWIDKEDVSPRDIYGAMLDAAPPAPYIRALAGSPPSAQAPGMTDLMISPEAIDEALAAAPQPPEPAEDVAALRADFEFRERAFRYEAEKDAAHLIARADAAEAALAEAKAECDERLMLSEWRATAERDRLAEAVRAYIRAVDRWCALLAEGDTADAAHVACSEADVAIARDRLDAALAQPKPEKERRS